MGVGFRVVDLEETALGVTRVQSLMYPHEDLHISNVDFAASFIKTKGYQQLNAHQLVKSWYIYTVKGYSPVTRSGLPTHVAMATDLNNVMLRDKNQPQHHTLYASIRVNIRKRQSYRDKADPRDPDGRSRREVHSKWAQEILLGR